MIYYFYLQKKIISNIKLSKCICKTFVRWNCEKHKYIILYENNEPFEQYSSFLPASAGSYAQNFADYFQNKTLRVDYIFTGNNKQQAIYLDELSQLPSWAGREHHLSELPLEGNGQIIVKDLATGQCIYKTFLFFTVSGVVVHR